MEKGGFLSLPFELHALISTYLPLKTLLSLSQTCRTIHSIYIELYLPRILQAAIVHNSGGSTSSSPTNVYTEDVVSYAQFQRYLVDFASVKTFIRAFNLWALDTSSRPSGLSDLLMIILNKIQATITSIIWDQHQGFIDLVDAVFTNPSRLPPPLNLTPFRDHVQSLNVLSSDSSMRNIVLFVILSKHLRSSLEHRGGGRRYYLWNCLLVPQIARYLCAHGLSLEPSPKSREEEPLYFYTRRTNLPMMDFLLSELGVDPNRISSGQPIRIGRHNGPLVAAQKYAVDYVFTGYPFPLDFRQPGWSPRGVTARDLQLGREWSIEMRFAALELLWKHGAVIDLERLENIVDLDYPPVHDLDDHFNPHLNIAVVEAEAYRAEVVWRLRWLRQVSGNGLQRGWLKPKLATSPKESEF